MTILIKFILFTYLFQLCNACQFDRRCFRYSSGCALSNAFPYERKSPITCTACLNRCLQQQNNGRYSCRAVVYDGRYRMCDLFAVNAGAGSNRHLQRTGGRCYFQPTGYCRPSTPAPPPPTLPPVIADCPTGQVAKVIAIRNSQYPGISGTTVPNVDERTCGQLCLKNQLPNGGTMNCKAAQYGPGNQCVLSTSQVTAVEGAVQSSQGSTFYQKVCFPTTSVTNCPDIFEEDPQKILVGQNRQTVDATSLQDCLQKCLDSQTLYGFACKSGMIFYQQTTLNCILNSESKTTKPDLFTDAAPGDTVTYFEPGCNGGTKFDIARNVRSRQLKDMPVFNGEWTLWTRCDSTDKQFRYRQCEKSDPRQCEKQERSCQDIGNSTSSTEDEKWFRIGGDSTINDGNAKNNFTPCQAISKNGNKNCTFGIQSVDGDVIYCSAPVDC